MLIFLIYIVSSVAYISFYFRLTWKPVWPLNWLFKLKNHNILAFSLCKFWQLTHFLPIFTFNFDILLTIRAATFERLAIQFDDIPFRRIRILMQFSKDFDPIVLYTAPFSRRSSSSNGILLPKLFWLTVRKNCSSDLEKLFEVTRTIYSNRSEQFLVTECFFNLFLEVSHI